MKARIAACGKVIWLIRKSRDDDAFAILEASADVGGVLVAWGRISVLQRFEL